MDDLFELSREDFDLLQELPVCGCGRPELVLAIYHAVLRRCDQDHAGAWSEKLADAGHSEALWYTVAYVLDHIEATEHGGGVGGAWTTDKGKRLLAILDRYAESDYEATPCTDVHSLDGDG